MEQLENTTTTNSSKIRKQSQNSFVMIRDFLFLCLGHWWWFVISLGLTIGYATYYLKKTTPVYVRSASILLHPDDATAGTNNLLKKMGITRDIDYNVNNEIMSMKTIPLAVEVVKRLNLDVNYMHDGLFRKDIVYGVNLPVVVKFEGLNDNENVSMNLSLRSDGTVILSNMVRHGVSVGNPLKLSLGKTIKSPFGKLTVKASPYYKKGVSDNLEITRSNVHSVANSLLNKISVGLRKNSTVIDVTCRDASTARAEDILNTWLMVYNENWIKNRNQVTISTNDFIKERLAIIERELGSVDQNISDYKSSNLMLDVKQFGSMQESRANETEIQAYNIENQVYMLRYVRNYLTDGFHDNQLLPSSAGLGNASIEAQISQYNNILLQRNNHLANSSTQNPLIIELDQHLASLRVIIIQSIDNALALLQAQKNRINERHNKAVSAVAVNPGQQKDLLSIERQQKVKESLYLFLLQRREENELSQAFTAYNTQIIEVPHGSMAPVSPDKNNVWLIALVLGFAIPVAILMLMESMNTVVRGRKDLAQLTVPFVGEIPLAGGSKKSSLFKQKEEKEEKPELVVVEKSRNVMNEAFRVIRTNLEFMLGFENNHQVIMITSMNPGSGKTFITANLSSALAIKDKKVLAIDLDLRRASLSKYLDKPHKGISNYLSGQEADYHSLIKQLGKVDVLPCGKIPPNPTELLFSPKFQQLIEEVREEYDFVFIDCPPVEIVADATIINRFVNLTLFVVRAQLLDRAFLADIEQWYDEKKFKNLSILLNGTTDAFSHYGYHRYGYRYGYHYGYYGYGYGEKDNVKK